MEKVTFYLKHFGSSTLSSTRFDLLFKVTSKAKCILNSESLHFSRSTEPDFSVDNYNPLVFVVKQQYGICDFGTELFSRCYIIFILKDLSGNHVCLIT
jgi:hypothetical protein